MPRLCSCAGPTHAPPSPMGGDAGVHRNVDAGLIRLGWKHGHNDVVEVGVPTYELEVALHLLVFDVQNASGLTQAQWGGFSELPGFPFAGFFLVQAVGRSASRWA